MKYLTRLLAVLAMATFGHAAMAATSDSYHSHALSAKLIAAQNGVNPDQTTLSAALQINLKDGWKTYWRSPGEVGLPPSVAWHRSQNLADTIMQWPAPTRFRAFGIENYGYEKSVTFPVQLILDQAGAATQATADLNLLVCSDICIPETFQLTLNLPLATGFDSLSAKRIAGALAKVPSTPADSPVSLTGATLDLGAKRLVAQFHNDDGFGDVDVFPEYGQTTFGRPDLARSDAGKTLTATFPVLYVDGTNSGLAFTLTDTDSAVTFAADGTPAATQSNTLPSIWWFLVLAFVGGVILNVMPCVLPVLSIKLASVIQAQSDSSAAIRASFLASAAGVLAFMLVLASGLAVAQSMGHAIGWGVQFQNPFFLAFVVSLLIFFAANMFGLFELALPHRWTDQMAGHSRAGLVGHFFTGAFAALLATPCSAPFLGTAVTFALTSSTPHMFAIFCALGLGLSLPYLIFAIFPDWIRYLPKPGAWMNRLRMVLGLLLVATSIWLLSVLWTVNGGLVACLVGLIAVAGIVARTATPHRRHKTLILGAALVCILAVPALIAPPAQQTAVTDATDWQPFGADQISAHVANGKTVFVDVTADWCLTCKANKKLVLDSASVTAALNTDSVTKLRADWTRADPQITAYLMDHGRFGIPFNIVYGPSAPNGIPLPEVLTKAKVIDALTAAR